MQEIRPSSEDNHSSNYCSPDQSAFCNSATESTTNNNNEGNTDYFTAHCSSTDEKADDRQIIAVCGGTIAPLTTNEGNTDHSTACGSSPDRSAEARRIIAANSNAEYNTAGTSWSSQ